MYGAGSRFIALNDQITKLRTEIARRIDAEKELQEQREFLQVTLSSIGDAVITTDVEGRITFMNPVAENLTGWEQRASMGQPLTNVFTIRHEQTGAVAENPVDTVLATGRIVGLQNHTVLLRRDGAQCPIDDSAAPIRDAAGRLFGVVLVFHEVSERRRLQKELLRQAEALKQADRRKDEFLATLAHELRNPLAPLRNGLQIARRQLSDDEQFDRIASMMDRQLRHLVRLVDDLMDVNRVSRGMIELKQAPISIRELIAGSVEAVRGEMDKRRHQLHVSVPSDELTVNGDAHRLVQVFTNLLINSAKYSPDESRIDLSATLEGSEVVVRVADTGIGIPQDQLEQVFEMFSQVRVHQGRTAGGLGIGLSLVRTLVQIHGGSVSAHSDGHGTGSTFTVRLPSVLPSITGVAVPEVLREHRRQPLRILVVDDNADAAHSLRRLLQLDGHDVRAAFTGREAIDIAQQFSPALVFMDVGMPDMDGIEATRRLRERPEGRDLVIVALTGWGQTHDREQTREAGVDRHIVKPISSEELAEVLSLAYAPRSKE